jgi:release factor glutamine methyltransferase
VSHCAVIARAARTLADAGVPAALVDAELLAAHVLGVPRGRLALAEWPAPAVARFEELVAARARRVPLQHLTGAAPFRYLELAVGPGVFTPRPETELLVDWGLRAIAGQPAPLVVDLCSGSGAIALAVAQEHPGARVVAVERDKAALEWLGRNAAGTSVRAVAGDVADATVLSTLDGTVDLVLCNPPYVPDGAAVTPEVIADPPESVFGGPDGLAVIRVVASRAATLLRSGGQVGIEHDEGHPDAVLDLLRTAGLTEVADHDDLAGRPRFATARRP